MGSDAAMGQRSGTSALVGEAKRREPSQSRQTVRHTQEVDVVASQTKETKIKMVFVFSFLLFSFFSLFFLAKLPKSKASTLLPTMDLAVLILEYIPSHPGHANAKKFNIGLLITG